MNFRTFGGFIIAIAVALMLAGGGLYSWVEATHHDKWKTAWREAISKGYELSAHQQPEVRAVAQWANTNKNRAFWFAAVGGGLFVLGFGIFISAKKSEEQANGA